MHGRDATGAAIEEVKRWSNWRKLHEILAAIRDEEPPAIVTLQEIKPWNGRTQMAQREEALQADFWAAKEEGSSQIHTLQGIKLAGKRGLITHRRTASQANFGTKDKGALEVLR